MKQQQHGVLLVHNKRYYFRHGHKSTNKIQELTHLQQCARDLIKSHQLFEGHPPFKNIRNLHVEQNITLAVARHVSAAKLMSHEVTTPIYQRKLPKNDKDIWDKSYNEEYYGLQSLPCLHTITES